MRGHPAERWFEGFSDGWIMSLDVTAVRHLLLAWLTVQSFYYLSWPWIARNQNQEQNHLATLFPVF